MSRRGLLGRLDGSRGTDDTVTAVTEHLRVLLNTRQGDSASAPSFGLMDFTDALHTMPDSIPAITASIRASVLEFEPRLKNVSVRHLPSENPLELRFELVGRLNDARRTLVRLRTRMASDGRFEVT